MRTLPNVCEMCGKTCCTAEAQLALDKLAQVHRYTRTQKVLYLLLKGPIMTTHAAREDYDTWGKVGTQKIGVQEREGVVKYNA